jgi:hypothetical protein
VPGGRHSAHRERTAGAPWSGGRSRLEATGGDQPRRARRSGRRGGPWRWPASRTPPLPLS